VPRRTNARTKFVLNTSSLAIAVEKLCVAVNLVYQAVTYQVYQDAQLRAPKTYVGQIVLNVATLMVFLFEIFICLKFFFNFLSKFFNYYK
jgi:hypothetical protein